MSWLNIDWTDLFFLGLMALMWWAADRLQELAKEFHDWFR